MDACHAYTVRESLGAPLREVMAWLSNLELMSLIQPEVSISSLDPSLTLQEGTRWVEARVGNASLFLRPSAGAGALVRMVVRLICEADALGARPWAPCTSAAPNG